MTDELVFVRDCLRGRRQLSVNSMEWVGEDSPLFARLEGEVKAFDYAIGEIDGAIARRTANIMTDQPLPREAEPCNCGMAETGMAYGPMANCPEHRNLYPRRPTPPIEPTPEETEDG